MELLSQVVTKLKLETEGIADNYILNLFDTAKCAEIDQKSEADDYLKIKGKKCLDHLKKCFIDHQENYVEAFNCYNEMLVYLELGNRCTVRGLIEADLPQPDYVVTSKAGFELNLDLKIISANDPEQKFENYQEQSKSQK